MPTSNDPGHDPLRRLDERLTAFDTGRRKARTGAGFEAADGYRLLGQMLGGMFGGTGLGWLLDRFAHTSPFGVVGGLLIGTTLAVVTTIRTANRMSARAQTTLPPAPPAPTQDDDDD
jgi:ATP synthase protein I